MIPKIIYLELIDLSLGLKTVISLILMFRVADFFDIFLELYLDRASFFEHDEKAVGYEKDLGRMVMMESEELVEFGRSVEGSVPEGVWEALVVDISVEKLNLMKSMFCCDSKPIFHEKGSNVVVT